MSGTVQRAAEKALTKRYEALLRLSQTLISIRYSGGKGFYEILVKDGYNVSIVQEPETSFKEDVAATKRTLALQDGPCIAAHSYGGAVTTEAGTDPPVAGLVYVAAHMPDARNSPICCLSERNRVAHRLSIGVFV
jgi:hypothetical protein